MAADLQADTTPAMTPEQLAEIEREFDPETAFRPTGKNLGFLIAAILVSMSVYHFYASGFGLIRELVHRGIHLSFVLGLVFLLFGLRKSGNEVAPKAWYRFDGVPLIDVALAILAVAAAMYLPLLPPEALAQRVGNPSPSDIFMGSCLLILTLEATRRSIGPTLPIIGLLFIGFAYFGPWMPGALKHGGSSWLGIINHLYMTNQGIYGIAIGVMAKYVFLFILFGVLATRIGLGQLFIDIALVIAGRYSGGPAKVAIFSSAFMGTISGSSIANTVTTGALTIPAMKKVGYPAHFAAAVEATSSTGGQITPPILGAAAFIMVEYLEIPLRDVLTAALFPALLHYFGIFIMVHLEAKKLGLRGLRAEELPKLGVVLRDHWLSLIPLIILVYFILSGRTPDFAAVYGIIACVVVGFLNPTHRLTIRDLWTSLAVGAKNTLAVGAAAATVGVVVGVVTLTGVGFRLGYVVVQTATDIGTFFSTLPVLGYFTVGQWTLFTSLVLIAISCIIMGAGIPTTATYIILVAVAAPALAQLQVEPLVAHFFVFYYGVLADITPPVALAAYAAAGIAGSNPFKTGNTAFRLGIAKALVPFVFVYSPALLLVADGFTWWLFTVTLLGAMLGIASLGVSFSGYLFAPLKKWERWWVALVSFLFIAPGLATMAAGLILMLPIVILQLRWAKAK
ncbi:putative TRAP-transporter 4TM/12TM-fusion protein [Octadecabacter arcticus 238]|uniref:Putative TRAP-transporter 4TM/12TM-fusion protein n=1 Tax=Octadecabacter arcticus 238 TaxID=391616 RepID=M9RH49_9RHOB|nr:TRAP transporter permease [Octadecabacter arcticus]AGI71088.1 putative TRAP-transporter 4TM/12TM-fusion protein [Octadecabacter arcticus 238]